MTSKIQIKPKEDNYMAYEAIQTTTTDPSEINKGNFAEEPIDHIELKIEKEKIIKRDNLISNKIITKYPERLGNLRVFKFNMNGDPLIAIGPHWPFYVCLSTTIFIIFFLFFYFVWDFLDISIKVVGLIMYSFQFLSYTYVFIKNPGIPKNFLTQQAKESIYNVEKGFKYCNKCNIIINSSLKANHCHDCNICIEGKGFIYKIYLGYDHHCPWTSKCVGQGNIISFYLFVTSTMLLFGYIILALSMIPMKK